MRVRPNGSQDHATKLGEHAHRRSRKGARRRLQRFEKRDERRGGLSECAGGRRSWLRLPKAVCDSDSAVATPRRVSEMQHARRLLVSVRPIEMCVHDSLLGIDTASLPLSVRSSRSWPRAGPRPVDHRRGMSPRASSMLTAPSPNSARFRILCRNSEPRTSGRKCHVGCALRRSRRCRCSIDVFAPRSY